MMELEVSKDQGSSAAGVPARRRRVAVLYTHFPHYRGAVFNELRRSEQFDFSFFFDRRGVDATIASGRAERNDITTPSVRFGPLILQPAFFPVALSGKFDAYILLGNPYILTNWLYMPLVRLRKRKVLLWTHGWLRTHEGMKGWIRDQYYKLADRLLLYGDRARRIGLSKGFEPAQLIPIYNSLDYAAQKKAREHHECSVHQEGKTFLCVTRLVPEVRMDLAIKALAILNRDKGANAKLVVVGEGPLRTELEALAQRAAVPVEFTGALYREDELAPLFLAATAVVSPGKVGLLAMHALAYGVPVITHDDLDHQMPEVEALVPGVTGELFSRGSAESLAEAMARLIERKTTANLAPEAIAIIEKRYCPEVQCRLIEESLATLFDEASA